MQANWQSRRSVESPWFYAAWFCFFGALLLLIAGGKYGERQAGIERRFQARSQTQIHPPGSEMGDADERSETQDPAPAYSSPEDTVIPLWPLGLSLMMLAAVSAVMAVRAGYLPPA